MAHPDQLAREPLPADETGRLLRQIPMILAVLGEIRATLAGQCKSHYTVEEIAAMTGRAPYTVRSWVANGLIQAVRVSGTGPKGRLLIPHEELDKLLKDGRVARLSQTSFPTSSSPPIVP